MLIIELTFEDLSERIGQTFNVKPNPDFQDNFKPFAIKLIEVSDKRAKYGQFREDFIPFSLLFQGSKDRLLPQRIHRLEHSELGEFDVFLTPVLHGGAHSSQQDFFYYESIFN